MKTIGSQKRETLKQAGYKLVSKEDDFVVLKDKDTGKKEMWVECDDYSGYVIEINGKGYEFVRDFNE